MNLVLGKRTFALATAVAGLAFALRAGGQPTDTEGPSTREHRIGIWTYGRPLDSPDSAHPDRALNDGALRLLAARDVYLVFGTNANHLDDSLIRRLTRCKEHGIEVHLSVTPTGEGLDFVNIWSFSSLRPEIEAVVAFLDNQKLLGWPVTTLVYDMEALPEAHFPLYGLDWTILRRLRQYDAIQRDFHAFNDRIAHRYGLRIRICTDLYQAMDPLDGDDDICRLWGLMGDRRARMSYMAYRRGDFGADYVRAHCRLLRNGDTVILNAWKEPGYACWGDLDCAIADARQVLAFPNKELNVEIWALWYFLKAYGVDGLHTLVEALEADPSQWGRPETPASEAVIPGVPDSVQPEKATATDALMFGIRALDTIGPVLRAIYGVL